MAQFAKAISAEPGDVDRAAFACLDRLRNRKLKRRLRVLCDDRLRELGETCKRCRKYHRAFETSGRRLAAIDQCSVQVKLVLKSVVDLVYGRWSVKHILRKAGRGDVDIEGQTAVEHALLRSTSPHPDVLAIVERCASEALSSPVKLPLPSPPPWYMRRGFVSTPLQAPIPSVLERRIAPNGRAGTVDQFTSYFGELAQWERARPVVAASKQIVPFASCPEHFHVVGRSVPSWYEYQLLHRRVDTQP